MSRLKSDANTMLTCGSDVFVRNDVVERDWSVFFYPERRAYKDVSQGRAGRDIPR